MKGVVQPSAADPKDAHPPVAGVELAQEEALSRYEQLMGPSGMEAILNDDGTLPLGALAALPGGGLTLRSLNLRRSRGQAPARDRLADTMPSRPAFAASQADGDALSEGAEGQGTARPRPM